MLVLAVISNLARLAAGVCRRAVPVIRRTTRSAAGVTLLVLGVGAGVAVESTSWAVRWIAPAGVDAGRDMSRAWRWTARSLRAMEVRSRPLRHSSFENGRLLTGRALSSAARLAVATARVSAKVVPRLGAVVVAAGLLGWFGTGPTLRAAGQLADVADPPFPPLAQRSVVVAGDGTVLGTVHNGENRQIVPLDRVPALAQRMFTVAEDRAFFEHDGFDQRAIVRAAMANLRAGAVSQGASTITQQLVKQNLVGNDQTPWRKLRELVLATAIESETSKEQLLSRYLNQVYFGAGAYGIAAATETYFGAQPEELRPEQAALLAALVRAPSTVDPWNEADRAIGERNQVLASAAAEGIVDPATAAAWSGADLGLAPQPVTPAIHDGDAVAAVEREIASRPELGADPAARLERFRSGGWTVETTLDPVVQEQARGAVAESLPSSGPEGSAIAVVEPGTGRIRALHSQRPAEMAEMELASMGRRQPGSTFKPLAAIVALERGLALDQRLEGRSGVTFDTGEEEWRVDNFAGGNHGDVDMATALQDSVNTAFAQLGVAVGTERLTDVVTRFGIDPVAALGEEGERGPALALGGVRYGVTPLELANAYATMANDGVYVAPTVIEQITDAEGRQIVSHIPEPRRIVDPVVNAQVRSMLEAVVDGGTGDEAALADWRPFGKTGTSQDRADAWFVGAVPSLAAAVRVGDPLAHSPMPSATGGSVAAPVWQSFMSSALRDVPPSDFAPPAPLPPRSPLQLPQRLPPDS